MLISTAHITHNDPERMWNAAPETEDARRVASIYTTAMTVISIVGMARPPRSVSTSGTGPARET
jgi:hypothetical protein